MRSCCSVAFAGIARNTSRHEVFALTVYLCAIYRILERDSDGGRIIIEIVTDMLLLLMREVDGDSAGRENGNVYNGCSPREI